MRRGYLGVLVLSLSVFACKKEEPHDPLALPPAAAPEPAKPKKPLSELFSAKAPTFPAIFKGVTPGMTVDEAKKKIPELDKDLSFKLPDYGDGYARLWANDNKRIRSLDISVGGKESMALATAAWGKPILAKDTGDPRMWFNPEAKVRAKLEPTDYASVVFDTYVPAAEFLGSDKAAFAFEKGHTLIGMKLADVRKNYAANILETSAEANAAKTAEAEAFMGKKLDLGAAESSVELVYPPTEYESYEMKVYLRFEKGKVESYWFNIRYEANPQQKTDVLALMLKTYGEPKRVKDLGTPQLQFHKKPTIKIEDDSSRQWKFIVEK